LDRNCYCRDFPVGCGKREQVLAFNVCRAKRSFTKMTEPEVLKEPKVEDLKAARAQLLTQMSAPQSVERLAQLEEELRAVDAELEHLRTEGKA
jgi:hypothetical protein